MSRAQRIVPAIAMALLSLAIPAAAHHSISMIEISTPIWVKGTVSALRVIQPHVLIILDVTGAVGKPQHWTIEGPNLARFARMHADETFLKAGDAIEACGFPLKDNVMTRNLAEGSGGVDHHFVHGHLLVMPDGHRRLFGPYGKLDNCIRKGDQARMWTDFLATDPLGREAWCKGLTYVSVPSVAPTSLVNEINRGMSPPCK